MPYETITFARMEKKAKLTITVRESSLRRVKKYAEKHKTSISSMVDQFIDSILNAEAQGRLHPTVARLKGIIKDAGNDAELRERSKRN